MKGYELLEKNGIKYYSITAFAKTGMVKHGFSTRIGGISTGPFSSLNLAFHTGDEEIKVRENRKRFMEALDIRPEDTVTAVQVHGEKIANVNASQKGRGVNEYETALPATDALITNTPGLALAAFFADCVPVFFLDPENKVIGLAHAGWKGTVAKIAQKTLREMQKLYYTKPENVLVAVGPSIGPCHFEVDKPVIEKFRREFPYSKNIIRVQSAEKAFINLWEANRLQLIEIGVSSENIIVSEICTFCQHDLLFSYRYDNGMTGRMGALIMLNE